MMNVPRYKNRLLELEKQLSAQRARELQGGRDQVLDTAHDMGDAGSADVAAESHFTEAELDSAILQQVRDALARIENGTFGKCTVDGGPIESKRLDAVPWTPYCLKHQTLLEASGRERNWTL